MNRFITDLFTEADNDTWDLGRIMWALGVVMFFGLSVMAYGVFRQAFDPITFGTGFAAVLGAGGGMIWMKSKEQEKPKP